MSMNSTLNEPQTSRSSQSTSWDISFSSFTRRTADATGKAWSFLVACLLVILWLLSGPFLRFSETWQLTINTSTTIITFLMVFILQHEERTNTKAIHTKLDELILSIDKANNDVAGIENMP